MSRDKRVVDWERKIAIHRGGVPEGKREIWVPRAEAEKHIKRMKDDFIIILELLRAHMELNWRSNLWLNMN